MSFLLVYNFSLNFCWLDGLWPTVTTEQRLVVRKKFVLTWAHSVSEAKLGGVTPGACMRSNVPVALVSLLRSWTPTSHACWKAVLFSEVKQNLANARVGLYRRRLWGLQAMLLQRPHQALHSKILHIHKSAFWNFKRCKCVSFIWNPCVFQWLLMTIKMHLLLCDGAELAGEYCLRWSKNGLFKNSLNKFPECSKSREQCQGARAQVLPRTEIDGLPTMY